MTPEREILAQIDEAFGDCPKPDHFMDPAHCEDCAEHDQLLRDRTRETLRIEDVGNVCWNPISSSSAAGIAYYFPALARLALSPPTYNYGWYADLLIMHLTNAGADNHLLAFFDTRQRRAVSRLIERLPDHFSSAMAGQGPPLTNARDLMDAQALWFGA